MFFFFSKNFYFVSFCFKLRLLEPYTTREARIHLRHVRELVRCLDTADAVNGSEGASLSYLSSMTLGDRKKSLDRYSFLLF